LASTKKIEEQIIEFNDGNSEESSSRTIPKDSGPEQKFASNDQFQADHEEEGVETCPCFPEIEANSTEGRNSQVDEPSLQSDGDKDSEDDELDPTESPKTELVPMDPRGNDFQHVLTEIFKKIDIMNDGKVAIHKLREFFDRKYPDFSESELQFSLDAPDIAFTFDSFQERVVNYFEKLDPDHKAVFLFKLGYTPALLCFDSRIYALTFHSNAHFKVHSKLMSPETFDLELLAITVIKKGTIVPVTLKPSTVELGDVQVSVKVLKNR
jgi:hypothetical protein